MHLSQGPRVGPQLRKVYSWRFVVGHGQFLSSLVGLFGRRSNSSGIFFKHESLQLIDNIIKFNLGSPEDSRASCQGHAVLHQGLRAELGRRFERSCLWWRPWRDGSCERYWIFLYVRASFRWITSSSKIFKHILKSF